MRTVTRIGRDYLAQLVGFASALTERVLVPGLFLRSLGVSDFSAWSVVLAAASLIVVLDMGIVRYFTNRLVNLVEAGRQSAAVIAFSQGLAVMLVVSVFAPTAIVLVAFAGGFATGDGIVDRTLPALLIPLTIAMAARLFISLHLALYRAHKMFAYETVAISLADLLRTVAVVSALVLGADLVEAVYVFAGTTLITTVAIAILSWRRFASFRSVPSLPSSDTRRDMVSVAPGLGLATGLSIAFTALPTIVLGTLGAGSVMLAQFVLIRTLGNFARQMVNMFSSVFGLELARREARGDSAGYRQVFDESGQLLGVQVALGCAMIAVLGDAFFAVWTGTDRLYDPVAMAMTLAPLIIVPGSPLMAEALTSQNRPWVVVRARCAQLAISALVFLVAPLAALHQRMIFALSMGELLGFAPVLALSFRASPAAIRLRSHAFLALKSVGIGVLAAALIAPVRLLSVSNPWIVAGVGGLCSGVAGVLLLLAFALKPQRRRDLAANLLAMTKRCGSPSTFRDPPGKA